MKIALGADHAGYGLKRSVAKYLVERGHDVVDFGTEDGATPVDYPHFCAEVARAVTGGGAERGIVFGGSGQGEQIAANKVRGTRAALCSDEFSARLARRHNDANVLSLGARILAPTFALAIVDVFLGTGFDGGRHERRLGQIAEIEREECRRATKGEQ